MDYQAIVQLLGYASGTDRTVRITTTDDHEVIGIPTSVDPAPEANEVFLHPVGDDETEIAIGLLQIRKVEFA